ncbi:putative transcription factor MYB-HB-like family [Helianthus anomalus]
MSQSQSAADDSSSDGSGTATGAGEIMLFGVRVKVDPMRKSVRILWTEDEHKLFLLGLQKVGKGDWRGISRNFVKTRTPTQVEHEHGFTGEIHIFVENHRHTQL